MVDVTAKPDAFREAMARGIIKLRRETVKLIESGMVEKGNPAEIAKVAGVLAAKATSQLIPLCHQLPLTSVKVDVNIIDESTVEVISIVRTRAQTGVEMEALTATSIALLTIWDMVKAYEKDELGQYPYTSIEGIRILKKEKAMSN